MEFVTDLNHRERAGLLADLSAVQKSMGKLIVALESADDVQLMIEYIICTLGWHSIRTKLDPVMHDPAEVVKGKAALDRFGGF